MKKMRTVQKITFGGIVTAIITVLMIAEGFITVGQYAVPALAGIMILAMSYSTGISWAMYTYICVSALSLILCSDKEASLYFLLFLGYYPILKSGIERVKIKFFAFILKMLLFNASATLVYLICLYVFLLPVDNFELFGVNLPLLFLLLLNIAFILYDTVIGMFELKYKKPIQKLINSVFRI